MTGLQTSQSLLKIDHRSTRQVQAMDQLGESQACISRRQLTSYVSSGLQLPGMENELALSDLSGASNVVLGARPARAASIAVEMRCSKFHDACRQYIQAITSWC